ncbi:MAG: phosphoenolpyruvate--protein phosphotransferase [Phycisphaeraceae bacterium]|nr:MAG: phosphoenolpyruvate--protein phosphotransferase [Phycisphaeraceae bacterium]
MVHRGLAVSPGVVIGTVMVLEDDIHRIQKRGIAEAQVKLEIARFDRAVKEAVAELQGVYQTARKEMGDEAAKIFLVHIGMLSDKRSFTVPVHAIIESERVTAEYAVSQVLGALAEKFQQSSDSAFSTKANDIEDLASRLMSHLVGRRESRLARAKPGTVVVANDLTPSQTAGIDRGKILGFATDLGGKTGHTAIVARALNIPAVVGCRSLMADARDGDTIVLDGDRGVIVLNPDARQQAEYSRYLDQRRVFQLSLTDLATLPATTSDGVEVELLGNIEFPEQAKEVVESGGKGIGLYRTEYLYLMSGTEPSERDHFMAYRKCVEMMKGRPVVIRTMDLGADKVVESRHGAPERNPFLGCRSIRLCLRDTPMFKTQLRAILRASALGPVKVMFPLITSLTELRRAKYILNDVMEDLAEDSIPFDRKVPVGMMVEVPAAALMADAFAREVDFFSIGTNDLVQYTLAVDRTNERIADLYSPMHPAVLILLRDIVKAARKHKRPVSCCGESAADLEYALLLIGLGLRTLSVSGTSIPSLKRLVRSVSIGQCERIARQALQFDSEPEVAAYLRDQARKIIPEAFDGRSVE